MTSITLIPNDTYNPTYSSYSSMSTSRKFFYKAGKLAGKTKRNLQKPEVKISAILSYWTLETVVCAVAIMSISSKTIIAATLLLYIYGTYALFSAISALV